MNFSSFNIGDVFIYEDKTHVFLAISNNGIAYTGIIVEEEFKNKIEKLADNKVYKNQSLTNPLYSYITLNTPELNEKMVNFAKTGTYTFNKSCKKLTYKLNENDIDRIKKELINNESIVIELINLIKNL